MQEKKGNQAPQLCDNAVDLSWADESAILVHASISQTPDEAPGTRKRENTRHSTIHELYAQLSWRVSGKPTTLHDMYDHSWAEERQKTVLVIHSVHHGP